MKIVHIATYINGGAGTAAYRIHEALLKQNIHSTFLCTDVPLLPATKAVVRFQKPTYNLWQRAIRKAKRLLAKYNTPGKINYRYRLQQQLNTMQPLLNCEVAGLPFSEYNLLEHPAVKNADIIHLHWVAGFIDYPVFFKNNTKPVVWTLHDMNPILGLYHYAEDEKRNQSISKKLNAAVKQIKFNAYKNAASQIQLVAPSAWLQAEVAHTGWFQANTISNIPYPINTEIFCNRNTDALRKELNIPAQNTVLLFVAQSIHNHRKGFHLLAEALKLLARPNISLLIIGDAKEITIAHLHCIKLGFVYDPIKLSAYYSLADAFILPSREDNLPNVMLESFACGTPVISFNIGGMATWIQDGFNGLKAEELTADSLKETIETFLKEKNNFNNKDISQFAAEHFKEVEVATGYISLYKKLLSL